MKTDWSKYAKCGVCFTPAGAACQKVDGTVKEEHHSGRRKKTDWSKYGWCPTCERTAGAPCRDTRYARATGHFDREWPHSKREKAAK